MLLVHDFLEASAAKYPSQLALVCKQQRLSYTELDQLANRLANGLRQHGVQRGDRVVLLAPNSVELAVAVFAVLKADATFVPLNNGMKPHKVQQVVADCCPTAMIVSPRHISRLSTLFEQVDSLQFAVVTAAFDNPPSLSPGRLLGWDEIQRQFPATRPPRSAIDQDLACLIYTSGSTGDSKGVMSSHSNVVFAASSIAGLLHNVADDVILCALPLSFDYGLYQLLMAAKVGATLVLEQSFTFFGQIIRLLEREQVSGLPGVPTLFSMLLQFDLTGRDLSHLRYFTNTAAALPASHIHELARRFPQTVMYSMYGLTETKRTLYMPPAELLSRPDSVGIAIPGTEVWLVDEHDQRLGPHQIGELVIRGRHVMRGYWNNPVASAARYRPGPLSGETVCYSGDLFRRDEQGYYYFVGRQDDILKCRGEKVPPKEVEEVLYRMPEVLETAVIGVADDVLGQAVKAFIVLRAPGLTEQQVLRHCREYLEDFMVPRYIEFADSLPKNPNGKIMKSVLH